ncbi:MAG TPA: hypothetical protein VMH87_01595 [Pseudomonadales bacterium]|nr:hypothetical protein [Pseudomonadales bacterium]
MKKILITLIVLPLAHCAPAQMVVFDPTSNIQQILDETENLAEYAEMIDNEVQQIDSLSSQLQQLQQFNAAFGNPAASVNVTGVPELTADLTLTPSGLSFSAVAGDATGTAALTYDDNGVYHPIGATFSTPSGNQVQRETTEYKPNDAINKATENYTNVTANVLQRRQALKQDIANVTEALQSATTASDVQKLTGVLIGLNGALAATDREIDQALAVSVEQDIENRNDLQKQQTADQEEQKAEAVEAFGNYRTAFQLNTQPAQFPTGNTQ